MQVSSPTFEGIVILGVPRSGTTLVRRLLDGHPSIACPSETNLLSAAARFLQEYTSAGGLSIGVVPGLEFSNIGEAEVLNRLREFVFGFLREIAARRGKKLWAEKTAVDVFHLSQIDRLCGEHCRFVCVVRHPLDVVCSIKELSDKMEIYMTELHEYVKRYPVPYEAFAHAWADANRELLNFIKVREKQCILIRYEDLVASPKGEVKRLCDFLSEPTDVDALLQAALRSPDSLGLGDWKTYKTREVSDKSVGRWKMLSGWTVRRLAPIINPTMTAMGYVPLPESMPAPSGHDGEHRLQHFGRIVARLKMNIEESSGN